MVDYLTRRYAQRRALIIEQLGGRCRVCSSTESLEITYVRLEFKRVQLGRRLSTLPWWRVQQELMACQLLCASCHAGKMSDDMGRGHGGSLTGVRNCYCDLCKPLKQRYNRNRKVRLAIEEAMAEMGGLDG